VGDRYRVRYTWVHCGFKANTGRKLALVATIFAAVALAIFAALRAPRAAQVGVSMLQRNSRERNEGSHLSLRTRPTAIFRARKKPSTVGFSMSSVYKAETTSKTRKYTRGPEAESMA